MFTLVIGGAASGKSEYAENLILRSGALSRFYIATMKPLDNESRTRIARHRAMRARKCFETVECYTCLEHLHLPGRGAVLLECISNLVANELYSPNGAEMDTEAAILRGIDALLPQCRELVVVSNEVFSGGCDYEGDTLRYLRVLSSVNRALAGKADRVAEIVCGQAVYYKGEEPA